MRRASCSGAATRDIGARWLALAYAGLLDEEFGRMVFDPDTTVELRARGVVRSAAISQGAPQHRERLSGLEWPGSASR